MVLWARNLGRVILLLCLGSLGGIQLAYDWVQRVLDGFLQCLVLGGGGQKLGSAGTVGRCTYMWCIQHGGLRVVGLFILWKRAPGECPENQEKLSFFEDLGSHHSVIVPVFCLPDQPCGGLDSRGGNIDSSFQWKECYQSVAVVTLLCVCVHVCGACAWHVTSDI